MADVVTDRGAGAGTTLLGWVALILSVLALVLAWMAYDRTGANLDERIQQQVQQVAPDTTQQEEDTDTTETSPQGTTEEGTDTTDTTDTTTDGTTTDPMTETQQ